MEKISCTERVRNEEVLLGDKGERNIIQTVKRRKDNWIGHIWRVKCFLQKSYWRKDSRKDRSDGKTRKKN